MNVWRTVKIALILVCLCFQNISAGSIGKDFLLLSLLAKILKPRFVPLPIPFPLPLKFQKHTKKTYPVPIFSHGLSAHHVGGLPLDFAASSLKLAAHHELPSLTALSAGHHEISAIAPLLAGHHEFSAIAPLSSGHHEISAIAPFSSGHESIHKIVDVLDDEPLIIEDSNKLDSIHDDIEAIGGLDVLTDIDSLGEKQKWW